MELNTLQSWLWRAASSIRGEVDAARYKDYILPLVSYKRIDDVLSDELARILKKLDMGTATAALFPVRPAGAAAVAPKSRTAKPIHVHSGIHINGIWSTTVESARLCL